jgi:hypothetical protein
VELDGQTMFAVAFTIIAIVVAFGAVGFALWYSGDQTDL